MASNTLSTFAVVLLIASAMWFFHLNREERLDLPSIEVQPQAVAEATVAPARSPSSGAAPFSANPLPPQAAVVSGELQSLEQQLADAQTALQAQREFLAQLQQQSSTLSTRMPASDAGLGTLQSQSQIQNIMMELDGYSNLEAEINRQAEGLLRAQSSALQMQLQELDNNIRVQENLTRQTLEDINAWRYNIGYVTQQQAELARLQDLLSTQTQQLELMHQQRLLMSAQALTDAQAVQLQKQEALAGLAQDRSEAQGEVESLRDSIIRLQQTQRQVRQTQVSLSSQLRQAQQNLSAQEAQVQTLQSQVQQKRQELESFLR